MILASVSGMSLWLPLLAALSYAVPAAAAAQISPVAARAVLVAAWLLHAVVLASGLLGEVPHFGFAPALSVTAWLVLTVYAVEIQVFPNLRVRWALTCLGSFAVLLALAFPGQPLQSAASPWFALHLALGVACYGLFGAAVVHAWLMTRSEKQMRLASEAPTGVPLLTLERLTFRFVAAGFVLLSATLLAGLLFGEALYGKASAGLTMKWDHKAVFSVLSWLTFACLLVGRARFGWRGRKAVRVLYLGAGLLLLAYTGSRFVGEVILGRAV
ncbi:MAG: inner membrane protein YpjD [Burkholderiaceae bacterium]